MDAQQVKEIIDILPKKRTLFHYFKDGYCLELLQRTLDKREVVRVGELKHGRFSSLLQKPAIRDLLKQCGDGRLDHERLQALWPIDPQVFVLTLDEWGDRDEYSWCQTSRPGKNLVLQLNFCGRHDQEYRRRVKPAEDGPFVCYGHPVHEARNTLAWARLDMDFNTGELLVEEIQNDWLREAEWALSCLVKRRIRDHDIEPADCLYDISGTAKDLERYVKQTLAEYRRLWSEAMLTAVLWFARVELGLNRLYYHSFETGNLLKGLKYSKPPRSLYTELPRRFCFEAADSGPEFIESNSRARRRLKKLANPQWYCLQ